MLPYTFYFPCVVSLVFLVGCGSEPWQNEDPQEALRMFVSSLDHNNHTFAWHFLTPKAQETLRTRAESLPKSDADAFSPSSLLLSSGTLGVHDVARYERKKDDSISADRASFVLTTHDKRTFPVDMQRIDGVWRVHVPALEAP